ncbi:hypothetical protein BC829DRAFT_389233 [Chytridium lagenaria]|nr:hypothetical protein BC829DRAFT_389233 [Chytridium lagenaria]
MIFASAASSFFWASAKFSVISFNVLSVSSAFWLLLPPSSSFLLLAPIFSTHFPVLPFSSASIPQHQNQASMFQKDVSFLLMPPQQICKHQATTFSLL